MFVAALFAACCVGVIWFRTARGTGPGFEDSESFCQASSGISNMAADGNEIYRYGNADAQNARLDAMGDNATVAVHVNRLREKLEKDPSDPKYIQTVWGAGYRFRA